MTSALIILAVAYIAVVALFTALSNDLLGLRHFGVNGAWSDLSSRPVTFGVMHYRYTTKGRKLDGEHQEYFLCLRLPIYGMRYQIHMDDFRWSQDILYIGANRGFHMFSRALPPTAAGL